MHLQHRAFGELVSRFGWESLGAVAHQQYAAAMAALRQPRQATAAWEEWLRRYGGTRDTRAALRSLFSAYRRKGDLDAASDMLRRYAQRHPSDIEHLASMEYWLAISVGEKHPERGKRRLTILVRNYPSCHYWVGLAKRRLRGR